MQQNYEGTVLFWLLPSRAQHDDLSAPIASLQKVINDTRVFFNPDQCIDKLASITDHTIFLILGPTRSDLLPILHTFDYLRYIYLSEPHAYTQHTSQVRGVFPTINQLLPQLSKDVRRVQEVDSHLILTYMGDPSQPHRSIVDLQSSKAEFEWRQTLIDVIFDTPILPKENIHKDLIDEWRLVYRSNIAQTEYIDQFEKEYDPSNAIYWYTRHTFLFKMVNIALRTENIAVIWRLRFYIHDLYQALKQLHQKQRKTPTGTRLQTHTLYRGQHMSATEVIQLKACVGGLIAMISFVSTTKQLGVAEAFAGNGEGEPEMESVIFEFIIDESVHDCERSPFADISAFSSKPAEEEVLLCAGIVLRVELLETKGQVTWVRVRTCEWKESEVLRTMKSEMNNLLPKGPKDFDEIALGRLLEVLLTMNDSHRMGQIAKMLQSPKMPPMNPRFAPLVKCFSVHADIPEANILEGDLLPRLLTLIDRLKQDMQSFIGSNTLDRGIRDHCILVQSLLETCKHCAGLGGDFSHIATATEECLESEEKLYDGCFSKCWTFLRRQHIDSMIEILACRDPTSLQRADAVKKAYHDKTFPENDFRRIYYCLFLACDAYGKGDYDELIRLLRDGLTIRTNRECHVHLYRQLLVVYNKQKNWLAAIECCQDIIKMPELPLSSPYIVQAYIDCAFACRQLKDYDAALFNYTEALERQDQHHSHRHPRTAKIYIGMGVLSYAGGDKATAMDYFQSAIVLDFPESTSEAHKWIVALFQQVEH